MNKEQLIEIQNSLREYINLRKVDISFYKVIAGVDCAYWVMDNVEYGVCCIEVFDLGKLDLIERVFDYGVVKQDYIPGFLAFRELPLILKTINKLKIKPDLFMIDGNGYLHNNHMGIATMFSIYTGYPSIGVAKSYYRIDDAILEPVGNNLYDTGAIVVNKECYGYGLRSRVGCNPIFVSPGNYIDFDSSLQLVKKCLKSDSRIPVPIRRADIRTHEERKKLVKIMKGNC